MKRSALVIANWQFSNQQLEMGMRAIGNRQSAVGNEIDRQSAISPGLHRFALLVACATFCLIIAGALVTSHDAGLATADWPLTEGHFLPKAESWESLLASTWWAISFGSTATA